MSRRKKHWCVKYWYIKVVAYFLLLLFLLRTTYLNISPREPYDYSNRVPVQGRSMVREIAHDTETEHADDCLIPHFKHKLVLKNSTVAEVLCKRLKPLKNSCQVARRLFQQKNPEKHKLCQPDGAADNELCKIQSQGNSYTVLCNISSDTELGMIETDTGSLVWNTFTNRLALESAIMSLLKSPNTGFCLIKYKGGDFNDSKLRSSDSYHDNSDLDSYQYEHDLDLAPPQILNLPPHFNLRDRADPRIPKNFINFNLIFLDSVSRHHFFRSLPQTVQLFEKTMMQSHTRLRFGNKIPIILDFELVQAIRSRTYESLQTLFAGSVNPFEKPFSTLAMPPTPLRIEDLMNPLKELGYSTLWLEDLCYLWEWGISKDLLVHNKELKREETWKNLHKALERAGIDSLGNTYAHCDILKHNQVNDHFHGPDKVCYNGKHQHFYSLEYLKYYQEVMHSNQRPYFTVFETNIGHEDSGMRIQGFDTDFVDYLKFLNSQDNTMTIIFSDHGNAYGKFMEKSQEAKIELFHPFLFMILPKGVRNILHNSDLKNLIANQERLVSLLDLHYTLTYIISSMHNQKSGKSQHAFLVSNFNKQFNVTSRGMLSRIPESRTCSQMPRINPNLCICEGYETTVTYNPFYFTLALYAIGELNNHIQKQRRNRLKEINGGFGNCQRLVVAKVENIRESRSKDDRKTVKMDILTQSPLKNKTEIFFVAIDVPLHHDGQVKLTRFERVSAYSVFGWCSDPGVDLQLCICNLNQKGPLTSKPKPHIYDATTVEKAFIDINGEKCVHLVAQSVDEGGIIFECYNSCKYKLSLTFVFQTSNMILSSDKHVFVDMIPKDVVFLMAGLIENMKEEWTWSIQTQYQVLV